MENKQGYPLQWSVSISTKVSSEGDTHALKTVEPVTNSDPEPVQETSQPGAEQTAPQPQVSQAPSDQNASAGDQADNSDSRSAFRARTLKAAKASFNDQFCAVPCVIKNISQTGALVRFTDEMAVPAKFTLFVELDGYKVECERVWQRGTMAGVRFIGNKTPVGSMRSQVLKPSETALDQQTVEMMQARERAQRSSNDPAPVLRRGKAPKKPTFGKRV